MARYIFGISLSRRMLQFLESFSVQVQRAKKKGRKKCFRSRQNMTFHPDNKCQWSVRLKGLKEILGI